MELVKVGEKTWRIAVIHQSFFTANVFAVGYVDFVFSDIYSIFNNNSLIFCSHISLLVSDRSCA